MKRILSQILTFCISLMLFVPIQSNAAIVDSGSLNDTVIWSLDDRGTLTISGTGSFEFGNYDYENTVPWYSLDVKNVIVEDGITKIGNRALSVYVFRYGAHPETITIKNSSDIEIGDEAFTMITSQIEFYGNVIVQGKEAFRYTNISDISLSEQMYYLPKSAFENCSLQTITIPENVCQIAERAFYNTPLINITLPQSLLIIGANAFNNFSDFGWIINGVEYNGIENIYYSGNQTQWNNIKIISGNEGLFTGEIHHSNTPNPGGMCGTNAFWKVKNGVLEISGTGEVIDYVYGSRNEIDWQDFEYPLWLTCNYETLNINEGITRIGNYSFDEMISEYAPGDIYGIYDDENDYNLIWTGYNSYYTKDNIKKIYIPKSVKYIGMGAFNTCNNLSDVYYAGTKSDWNKIEIESENSALTNANLHFSTTPANEITDFSFKYSSSGHKITTLTANLNVAADVYIAAYDKSGRLIDAQSKELENNSVQTSFTENNINALKAFIWVNNNEPLTQAAIIK